MLPTTYLPLATDNIRMLKNRLAEYPYNGGLTVIKELLQNADDAGAESVTLAILAHGEPTAHNSLLHGPALLVWNNAPISEAQAENFYRPHGSSKSADELAVGRFGIGQQSVYHLCEAWLFIGWGDNGQIAGVLDPWARPGAPAAGADPQHPDWPILDDEDREVLVQAVRQVGVPERGLLLWLPLRQPSHAHGEGRIKDQTVRAGDLVEELRSLRPLMHLLPLLEHVHRVSLRSANSAKGPLREEASLTIEGPRLRKNRSGAPPNESPVGRLCLRTAIRPGVDEWVAYVLIQDNKNDIAPLKALRDLPAWPTVDVPDEVGGVASVPEKVSYTGATLVIGAAATSAALRLSWASFLPLGEPELPVITGAGLEWSIVVHGGFFPDSGRKVPLGFGEADHHHREKNAFAWSAAALGGLNRKSPQSPDPRFSPGDYLKMRWNLTLLEHLTASTFISALARAIEARPWDEAAPLVEALCQSKLLSQGPGVALTRAPALLLGVNPDGSKPAWRLMSDGEQAVEVPWVDPGSSVWKYTIQAIQKALRPTERLTFRDKRRLGQAPTLAETDPVAAICEAQSLPALVAAPSGVDWLHKLCQGAGKPAAAARQLLQTLGEKDLFPSDAASSAVWRDLAALVPRSHIFASRKHRWLKVIAPHLSGVVALPHHLASATQAPWTWPNDVPEAEWLAALIAVADRIGRETSEEAKNELAFLAAELISAVGPARVVQKPEIAERKLFRLWSARQSEGEQSNSYVFVSLIDVNKMREAQLLWPNGGFPRPESSAKELLRALPVDLNPRDVWMVKDEGLAEALGAPSGSLAAWARVLARTGTHPLPRQRAGLLNLVLRPDGAWPSGGFDTDRVKIGLRNLLAGGKEPGASTESLWNLDLNLDPLRATVEALAKWTERPWRALPAVLTGGLTMIWEKLLHVERFTVESLGRELGKLEANDRTKFLESLTVEHREELMAALVGQDNLWRRLPGHAIQGGGLAAVDDLVREAATLPIPTCLRTRVKVLEPAHLAALWEAQETAIQPWTSRRQVNAALDALNELTPGPPVSQQARAAEEETYSLQSQLVEALVGGLVSMPPPDAELQKRLQTTAWLPLRAGGFVRPLDVVPLSDGLRRVVAVCWGQHQPPFSTESDVSSQDLDGILPLVRRLGNTEPKRALDELISRLPESSAARERRLVILAPGQEPPLSLKSARALPGAVLPLGWQLVQEASAHLGLPDEAEWSGLPDQIFRLLRGSQQAETVADWIAALEDQVCAPLLPLLASWMVHFAGDDSPARQILAKRCLPNADGQWRNCQVLTSWQAAPGSHRLHPDLIERLACEPIDARPVEMDDDYINERPPTANEIAEGREALPAILNRWSSLLQDAGGHLDEACGIFLSLCGIGQRDGAARRLGNWKTPQAVIEAYQLNQPPYTTQINPPGPQLALRCVGALSAMEVKSVVGMPLQIPQDSSNSRGFFAGLFPGNAANVLLDGTRHWLILREPDETLRSRDSLLAIFQSSTLALCRAISGNRTHNPPQASALWTPLATAHQIDLSTALIEVIGQLPDQLKVLQVKDPRHQAGKALSSHLGIIKNAKLRRGEFDQNPNAPHRFHEYPIVINALMNAQNALARSITDDLGIRLFVLDRIRERVSSVQYDIPRVPWELLQNADDALGQILEMEAHEGHQTPFTVKSFRIEERCGQLLFWHWGRRINQTRSGAHWSQGQERGYDQDLLNMLTFAASDKVLQQGATGRFGLGFKSCYLVCDAPQVQSGDLCFEVQGGLVPVKAEPIHSNVENNRYPPTITRLPLRAGVEIRKVLSEIAAHGWLATVFARHLRTIKWGDREVTWKPNGHCLLGDITVEVGSLKVWSQPSADVQVIALRRAHPGGLQSVAVFDWNHGHPRPFPREVPTLWVTAPLKLTWDLGWLLGGNFSVDTGRTQLGQTAEQKRHDEEVARGLGEAIGALLRAIDSDTSVTTRLQIGTKDKKHRALLALFPILRHGLDDGHAGATNMREILLKVREGWMPIAMKHAVVPTELPGDWDRLTRGRDIRYTVDRTLTDFPELCERVSGWKPVADAFPPGTVVSPSVADAVGCKPQAIGLLECVKRLIDGALHHGDGAHWKELGFVIRKLEGMDENSRKALREKLGKLRFPSEAGDSKTAQDIVARARSEHESLLPDELRKDWALTRDENRVAIFAPSAHVLHIGADSATDVLAVYLFVRKEQPPKGVNLLAQWARQAPHDDARHGVLVYLSEGERSKELAREIRENAELPWATHKEELAATVAYQRLSGAEKTVVLVALFPPSADSLVQLPAGPESEPPPEVPDAPVRQQVDLLRNLQLSWRSPRFDKFREKLHKDEWPDHWSNLNRLSAVLQSDEEGSDQADAWLTLLTLGAARSLGGATVHQHSGFVSAFYRAGIWRRLAGQGPPPDREEWAAALESWEDSQVGGDSYRRWLGLYATIHQLRRFLWVYRRVLKRVGSPEQIGDFLGFQVAPRLAFPQAGSQFDAPPLPLGLGILWVMREMSRLNVHTNTRAGEWSWFADGWLRRTLGIEGRRGDSPQSLSEQVSDLMIDYGNFDGWYDAALRSLKDQDIRNWLANAVDWSNVDADNEGDELFDREAVLSSGDDAQ
jgi:hypothetical protein